MVFLDEEIYDAVKHNLPSVNEYVSSHGGDITLLGVKDGVVYIELVGACKGCAMSLMTTKMVVQKKLRTLIHPELNVVNVDGTSQNRLPQDVYVKSENCEIINETSIFEKMKSFLRLN